MVLTSKGQTLNGSISFTINGSPTPKKELVCKILEKYDYNKIRSVAYWGGLNK